MRLHEKPFLSNTRHRLIDLSLGQFCGSDYRAVLLVNVPDKWPGRWSQEADFQKHNLLQENFADKKYQKLVGGLT